MLDRRRKTLLGLALIGVYAAMGLDGLLPYDRAPFADHAAAMHATILFEAAAAAALRVRVAALLVGSWKEGER